MTTYVNKEISATALKVADVVRVFEGEWGTAIVKNIAGGLVHLYRPYGHAENWSYSGGVICYMGVEEFTRPCTDSEKFFLYRREELR